LGLPRCQFTIRDCTTGAQFPSHALEATLDNAALSAINESMWNMPAFQQMAIQRELAGRRLAFEMDVQRRRPGMEEAAAPGIPANRVAARPRAQPSA